jgi:hypothetical protein
VISAPDPRAAEICRTVFPRLLGAVRAAKVRLFHVVNLHESYKQLPGYRRAVKLAGTSPPPPKHIASDDALLKLRQFHSDRAFVGKHNVDDVNRGFQRLDFPPEARPIGDEGIAENAEQLCREAGVNHLIYAGFAINWCLLLSPGGMHDMKARACGFSVTQRCTRGSRGASRYRHRVSRGITHYGLATNGISPSS